MASSEGDIYVRQENSWVIRTALQWPECKKNLQISLDVCANTVTEVRVWHVRVWCEGATNQKTGGVEALLFLLVSV